MSPFSWFFDSCLANKIWEMFPTAQAVIYKLLVLSEQQPKTTDKSLLSHAVRWRKAENSLYYWKEETFGSFVWKTTQNNWQLISICNSFKSQSQIASALVEKMNNMEIYWSMCHQRLGYFQEIEELSIYLPYTFMNHSLFHRLLS